MSQVNRAHKSKGRFGKDHDITQKLGMDQSCSVLLYLDRINLDGPSCAVELCVGVWSITTLGACTVMMDVILTHINECE